MLCDVSLVLLGHSPATTQEVCLPWDSQAGVGLLTAPAELPGDPLNCGPVRVHRGPLMKGAPASIWLEGHEEPKRDVPRMSSSWIPNSQNQTKENGGFEATGLGMVCYTAIVTRTVSSPKIILKLIQNQNHENINITTFFFQWVCTLFQGEKDVD